MVQPESDAGDTWYGGDFPLARDRLQGTVQHTGPGSTPDHENAPVNIEPKYISNHFGVVPIPGSLMNTDPSPVPY